MSGAGGRRSAVALPARRSRLYNLHMPNVIDVADLPEPLVDAIVSLVNTYRQRTGHAADAARQRPSPPIGWLKCQWELPDSCFEPLPDDVLHLFDGVEGGR